MQWFKLQSDFITSVKVLKLSYMDQAMLVRLMCMHAKGEVTEDTTDEDAAIFLRITSNESATLHATLGPEFLVANTWILRGWDKHQGKALTSTERSRNRRERLNKSDTTKRNVACNENATRREEENRIDKNRKRESKPTPPFDEIKKIWNEILGGRLPEVQKLTSNRKQVLLTRWREDFSEDLSQVRSFFERVQKSNFLTGNNDRNFKAGFDWVLKPANMTKILEGNYDNRGGRVHRANGGYHAEPQIPFAD